MYIFFLFKKKFIYHYVIGDINDEKGNDIFGSTCLYYDK